jgi:hypothetical protein
MENKADRGLEVASGRPGREAASRVRDRRWVGMMVDGLRRVIFLVHPAEVAKRSSQNRPG